MRKTDHRGIDEASVVAKRVGGEHFLFDFGTNKVAEIASICLPPNIGLVRQPNRRDSCILGEKPSLPLGHANSPKSEWQTPLSIVGHCSI
jgi:hypothetical protein